MTDQDRTQMRPPKVGGSASPQQSSQATQAMPKTTAAPAGPGAKAPAAKAGAPKSGAAQQGAAQPGAAKTAAAAPAKNTPGFRDKLARAVKEATDEDRFNPAAAGPGGKPPRRARLRLTRVDPWSVMKMAFLLSIAFGLVMFVAVAIVWGVLGAAGVWDSINNTVAPLLSGDSASSFDITKYVGATRVLGFTVIVSVLDVILLTAMATLGAFLYNMAASLLGGIDVTLVEEER